MVDDQQGRTWVCVACWSDVLEQQPTCAKCLSPRPAEGWRSIPWTHKGRYLVQARLARGGMGAVFDAVDTHSDQRVALKLAQARRGERMVAVFEHEMELAGFLSRSPHFVTVFGWDGTEPAHLVMEFVDWPTLADLFARKGRFPLTIDEVARLGIGICRGLEVLDTHNLVHRDLKPENIFVQEGSRSWQVKLADLGAWQPATDPEASSRAITADHGPHLVVGTPAYMSPEQMYEGPLTRTSDVHGLGSILWEAATGAVPYPQQGPFDLEGVRERYHRCEHPPTRPDGMPEALYEAIVAALDIDPGKRPSAYRLRQRLERFLDRDLRDGQASTLNAEPDTTRRDPAITDPWDVTAPRRGSDDTTLERPVPADAGTSTFRQPRDPRWLVAAALAGVALGGVALLAGFVLHTVPLTLDIAPWATDVLVDGERVGEGSELRVPLHHALLPRTVTVLHPNFQPAELSVEVPWFSGVSERVSLELAQPLRWKPGDLPQQRVEGQQRAFRATRTALQGCLGAQELVAGWVEVRVDDSGLAKGVVLGGRAGENPKRARCLERQAAATRVPPPASGAFTRLFHHLAEGARYAEEAPEGLRLARLTQGSFRRPVGRRIGVVELSRPFYLSTTEVTRAQWLALMGEPPTGCAWPAAPPDAPATCVTWREAVAFTNRLSAVAGLSPAYVEENGAVRHVAHSSGYRLPTEAEWAYAAYAGQAPGATGVGEEACAGANLRDRNLPEPAVVCDDGATGLSEVGSYLPNDWGLFDMVGNASEWTWDRYGQLTTARVSDPTGAERGSERVVRGVDLDDPALVPLGGERSGIPENAATPDLGFRVARDGG